MIAPKVQVFTPSHDTRYLSEAYDSLRRQTFEDWSWVILLNGTAAEQSPRWCVDDPRVTVRLIEGTHGVGALKRLACEGVTAEILVELDHDDILASEALERIVAAFDESPQTVFVYSDFAQINEDGSRNDDRFDSNYGWRYEEAVVDGRQVLCCKSPQLHPATVSLIWFAPNHVRAFRRQAYETVGGYSASLDVLDDQDLMARLYLHGEFEHVADCLYLQRVHSGNTQVRPDLNERIQHETVTMHEATVQPCALAWATRQGLMALDMGAAHNKTPGYVGVDKHEAPGVDIVCDVIEGLPLPDNSVGVIRAVDFLEHVADKVALLNEFHRVLAHGGMLLSLTPSTDGRGAYQDPTHVAFYNENSFWYWTDPYYARFVPEITCRFQVSRLETVFLSDWHRQHEIPYVQANLIAIKSGSRIAGDCKWPEQKAQ